MAFQRFLEPFKRRAWIGTTRDNIPSDFICPMKLGKYNRNSEICHGLKPNSKVLEIGPLSAPIVTRGMGHDVFYADKLSQQELIEFYRAHGVKTDSIVEVDYIIKSDEIHEHIPADQHGTFDFIIASHVIEHIYNPIHFLNCCSKLLKKGGVLSLALPDKRYCFDFFRAPTFATDWILAFQEQEMFIRKLKADFDIYSIAQKGGISWTDHKVDLRGTTFVGTSLEEGIQAFGSRPVNASMDFHVSCFVPSSFCLLIEECNTVGNLAMSLGRVAAGDGAEFFAQLRNGARRAITHHERLMLLAGLAREQGESWIKVAAQDLART